jgi:hypothetical protein
MAAITQKLVPGLSMSSPFIMRFRARSGALLSDRLNIVAIGGQAGKAMRTPAFCRCDDG